MQSVWWHIIEWTVFLLLYFGPVSIAWLGWPTSCVLPTLSFHLLLLPLLYNANLNHVADILWPGELSWKSCFKFWAKLDFCLNLYSMNIHCNIISPASVLPRYSTQSHCGNYILTFISITMIIRIKSGRHFAPRSEHFAPSDVCRAQNAIMRVGRARAWALHCCHLHSKNGSGKEGSRTRHLQCNFSRKKFCHGVLLWEGILRCGTELVVQLMIPRMVACAGSS